MFALWNRKEHLTGKKIGIVNVKNKKIELHSY